MSILVFFVCPEKTSPQVGEGGRNNLTNTAKARRMIDIHRAYSFRSRTFVDQFGGVLVSSLAMCLPFVHFCPARLRRVLGAGHHRRPPADLLAVREGRQDRHVRQGFRLASAGADGGRSHGHERARGRRHAGKLEVVKCSGNVYTVLHTMMCDPVEEKT